MSGANIDWFEYEGLRIRYAERLGRGGSRPLLIFNGIGQSLEAWGPWLEHLPDAHLIAYDVPGTGLSEIPRNRWGYRKHAALAASLIQHLGHSRVNVLGVSWGGGLAQQFSHQYKEHSEKLILVASVVGFLAFPGHPKAYWLMLSTRRWTDPTYQDAIAGDIYGGDLRTDHRALTKLAKLQPYAPSENGYRFQAGAMFGWTCLPFLWRLAQPTLILHGQDDPLVPLSNARAMAFIIPKSRLQVLDCGHLFVLTRVAETAAYVQDFIDG